MDGVRIGRRISKRTTRVILINVVKIYQPELPKKRTVF
jgi:hypothetical protein